MEQNKTGCASCELLKAKVDYLLEENERAYDTIQEFAEAFRKLLDEKVRRQQEEKKGR